MSFKHENEVRAVLIDRELIGEKGISIKVDLERLIDKIYISPEAGDWFFDVVKDLVNKYGLKKEIIKSDLSRKPFY